MKISKDRLKEIIKEELEEADMRGTTAYTNPKFDGDSEEFKSLKALSAREAEAKNKVAFRILDDLRLAFVNASPDDVGTERQRDDAMFLLMSDLKRIYNTHMSKLRNEDPEVISIRQSNYPSGPTKGYDSGD